VEKLMVENLVRWIGYRFEKGPRGGGKDVNGRLVNILINNRRQKRRYSFIGG
jgi:hypothetical protein